MRDILFTWEKTLAGTDRGDIPRYLVESDFEPFPFQSGRMMAKFQSVGMMKPADDGGST